MFVLSLIDSSTKTSPLHLSTKAAREQQHTFAWHKLILFSLPPHQHLRTPLVAPCLLLPVFLHEFLVEQPPAHYRPNLLVERGKSPGPLGEENQEQLNKAQTSVGVPWRTATTLCILSPEAVPGEDRERGDHWHLIRAAHTGNLTRALRWPFQTD